MARSCLALLLAASCAFAAEPVRVALVHGSYSNFRHRDDYDGVMKELGWTLDKFENKDFGKLAGQLDNYDLILGTALYNYQENVQDFSLYRDQLQTFMQRGGAIVFTDTNYEPHVNWLAEWGPDWAVGLKNCQTTSTPNKWFDAGHPVFCAVAPTQTLGGTWMHMEPGAGWEVLARCEDDGATALFRPHGRGFMLLTSFWGYGANQLRNIRGTLQYTRAGILPRLPDLRKLTFGDNVLTGSFRNVTAQPLTLVMRVGMSAPGGDTPQFATEATAAAGQTTDMKLNVPLPRRGQYDVMLTLQVKDGAEFPGPRATITIPQLVEVEVTEPKYRGAIMLGAPPPASYGRRVRASVTLHPFEEKLEGAYCRASLWRGSAEIGSSASTPIAGKEFTVSVPAAPTRPLDGDCELEIALLRQRNGKPFHSTRVKVPVIPSRANQVLIDDDLNTRIDGKLFFPITVYHVATEDFPRVKALGFNSVQAWGSSPRQAKANLDAAQAVGLKVIIEGVTAAAAQGDLTALDPTLDQLNAHPALLSWYLTDEPSGEEKLAWCKRVYEYLQHKDPHHPVYLTSCSPGEFGRYAWVTDIFAVDPYPIPSSPVTMVSDWMQRAQEAVQGRKPVWLIPQLHNWAAYGGHPENGRYPTPEEERNMVYQGLVWGAKGIFYYPWDDGSTGLIKDEKLMAAVGQINGELAQLGPELLTCRHEVLARNEGEQKGLYAGVYWGKAVTYLLAVSVEPAAKQFSIRMPQVQATSAEVLFEQRNVAVKDGTISDGFAPLGVHVYRIK